MKATLRYLANKFAPEEETMDLPRHGKQIPTDNGDVKEADQSLLVVLELLDETYGWVQVLKVLRDNVASKYAGGVRFADYLIKAEEYKARWTEAEGSLDKGN
jgi:hypothetical protein